MEDGLGVWEGVWDGAWGRGHGEKNLNEIVYSDYGNTKSCMENMKKKTIAVARTGMAKHERYVIVTMF